MPVSLYSDYASLYNNTTNTSELSTTRANAPLPSLEGHTLDDPGSWQVCFNCNNNCLSPVVLKYHKLLIFSLFPYPSFISSSHFKSIVPEKHHLVIQT